MRASIETYNSKIDLKDHEIATLRDSYERELSLSTG
jgi:chromosome segregation ATPase